MQIDNKVVAVTGEDALPFLDNLVTNSLDGMEEGSARFAALLNPQGKILFPGAGPVIAQGS